MNKLKLSAIGITIAMGLVGCADVETVENPQNKNFEVVKREEEITTNYYCHDITIIRDKETGVEYLLLGDDGITPRLKGDKDNE
jgi:hypothetical protein